MQQVEDAEKEADYVVETQFIDQERVKRKEVKTKKSK